MYLTFDDGPINGTQNIIDVIDQEQVPVTFFMIGDHIERSKRYNALYQKAKQNPLILVANHTYSHARGGYRKFYYSPSKVVIDDLMRAHNILSDNGKINTIPYARLAGRNVYRLPTISTDDIFISKKQVSKEKKNYDALWDAGFYLYGWDYQWEFDYKNKRPKLSVNNIVRLIERKFKQKKIAKDDKFVLLMHDQMFKTSYNGKENLQKLIQKLKENGWEFDTIANYLTQKDFLYAKYHQAPNKLSNSLIAQNFLDLPSTPIEKSIRDKISNKVVTPKKKVAIVSKPRAVNKTIAKTTIKLDSRTKYSSAKIIMPKKPKIIITKPKVVKKPIVKKAVKVAKTEIKYTNPAPLTKKELINQLFDAINKVDEKKTLSLIRKGVDIHACNKYGQSALVLATTLRKSNIVEMLINNGADINQKDKNGNSALMVLQGMSQ